MRDPLTDPRPGDVVRIRSWAVNRFVVNRTATYVTYTMGDPVWGTKIRRGMKRWTKELSEGVVVKVAYNAT